MARKTQRRPDKIELGVVDIHTHVLPGIDDGAEKMAVSYRITCNNGNQRPLINP